MDVTGTHFDAVESYLKSLQREIERLHVESTTSPADAAAQGHVLAVNVINEIKPWILQVSMHQNLGKYLEKITLLLITTVECGAQVDLPHVTDACTTLLNALVMDTNVEDVAKHVFASHVLEKVLKLSKVCIAHGAKFDEQLHAMATIVEERCLYEMLHHTCGCHVLRGLIGVLATRINGNASGCDGSGNDVAGWNTSGNDGIEGEAPDLGSTKCKENQGLRSCTPKEGENCLEHSENWQLQKLQRWSYLWSRDVKACLSSAQASATVIVLLKCCRQIDVNMGRDLLQGVLSYSRVAALHDKVASFALEAAIELLTEEELKAFLTTIDNVKEMSMNPLANYGLVAVVRHPGLCKDDLARIIKEPKLPPSSAHHFTELDFEKLAWQSNSSALLWRTCEACVTRYECQDLFSSKLFTLLDIKEQDTNFWPKLLACDIKTSSKEIFVRSLGCSLILHLLLFSTNVTQRLVEDFREFIKLAKSIDAWPRLACDKVFSRILQVLLDTKLKLLTEKVIKRLYIALKDHLAQVSFDVNGAFVVAALYKALTTPALKEEVLLQLEPFTRQLQTCNPKFVQILALDAFKANAKVWKEKQTKAGQVREMFRDILE